MKIPTGFNRYLLHWIAVRKKSMWNDLISSKNEPGTRRWHIFRPDEYWLGSHGMVNARPWWAPFNVFLHRWDGSDTGYPHDHPRWSISIVLRGAFMEHTPTQSLWRTAGSIVIRSHRYVHKIEVPSLLHRKTYTLFITGRRRWKQSYFIDGKPVLFEDFDRMQKGD